MFAISFLATLLIGASAVRAVVGGVCGFAAAFVLNISIVIRTPD